MEWTYSWIFEWWSVFIWSGVYLAVVGFLFAWFSEVDGHWTRANHEDAIPIWVWPVILVVGMLYYPGRAYLRGTSRLIRAIRKWWEKIKRARDIRKNCKIVGANVSRVSAPDLRNPR